MNSILYAANIGTFAAWLGFTGASTVGILISPPPQTLPELLRVEMPQIVMTDGEFMEVDMFAGGSAAASEVDVEANEEMLHQPAAATPEMPEIAPDIPEIPEIAETEPLPEVPELPEPKPELKPTKDTFAVAPKKAAPPKASVKRTESAARGTDRPVAKRTESGTGTGSGASNNIGAGAGDKGTGRISGGRTPKPPYPPMAKKKNIEGTVRVSITFGENGEVVNCRIVSASDPALNDSSTILSTIRRWKKPGMRGTHIQPFRFDLN